MGRRRRFSFLFLRPAKVAEDLELKKVPHPAIVESAMAQGRSGSPKGSFHCSKLAQDVVVKGR